MRLAVFCLVYFELTFSVIYSGDNSDIALFLI